MRADNDHMLGNSVDSCKDESKPHQCPEENWKDAEIKILENVMNNNNVCELFYDTRSGDESDKENDGVALERHSCGDSNELGKKIRENSRDFDANVDSIEKLDPVLFVDKNVMACDLPEIVVCYKESTYHVVKDICVDEGVPIQEKFLFGEKDSVKCSSKSEDLMKADKANVNPLEAKSSSEDSNRNVDVSVSCYDPKTRQDVKDFADAESSSNCNQERLVVTREAKDLPTHVLNPSEISLEVESEDNSKDVLKKSLTLGDILSMEDEQKPLNDDITNNRPEEQSPSQLQNEEGSSLEATALKTKLEETEELKKAEEKLSSVSTTTSQDSNKICNDHEKPETENQQLNLLLMDPNEFGETSFSAAEAVSISGHITSSGPIAFSGSLSVRSDASTTSGRSFAFPILQSEWNSSPVRMKKADKRRQKGWRRTLLCCRF